MGPAKRSSSSCSPSTPPTTPTRRQRPAAGYLRSQRASPFPRGNKLDTTKIDYIRLSTTVATNALLERKGASHAFVVTKGFRDLLCIGKQSRPNIFTFNIRRTAEVLYDNVLEVVERVTLVGYTNDPAFAKNAVKFDADGKAISNHKGEIVQGVSGEAVQILK
ncbi:hypothetical protein JCM21900_005674 [Sporobolomyces salmonicolor]